MPTAAPPLRPRATPRAVPPAVQSEPYEQDAERTLSFFHPTIPGLGVELRQTLDEPEHISVALTLRCFNFHSTSHNGDTEIGDPVNPDVIRALGEMLVAFADEADRRGMLTECRRRYLAAEGIRHG